MLKVLHKAVLCFEGGKFEKRNNKKIYLIRGTNFGGREGVSGGLVKNPNLIFFLSLPLQVFYGFKVLPRAVNALPMMFEGLKGVRSR